MLYRVRRYSAIFGRDTAVATSTTITTAVVTATLEAWHYITCHSPPSCL